MAQELSNMRADVGRFDPDTEQVRILFEAREEGFATLVIFDACNEWVLSLGEVHVRVGANALIWHGHDREGWPLANGTYKLELFGFGCDRRPTGAEPLRLQIELVRRPSNMSPSRGDILRAVSGRTPAFGTKLSAFTTLQ
ncbi:MAG: hypothetical protein ACR2M0_14225 [Chloroflexia bacterium]